VVASAARMWRLYMREGGERSSGQMVSGVAPRGSSIPGAMNFGSP
jgi:hypothetical protein